MLQGITFDEFRSFFQFLNNLEDFAIAMQMYTFAARSIGQGEQKKKKNDDQERMKNEKKKKIFKTQ